MKVETFLARQFSDFEQAAAEWVVTFQQGYYSSGLIEHNNKLEVKRY